jgi:protein-L-isoaspartate(D-aspartate) O-methyltransferase
MNGKISGIGMTSQRTRARMVERLRKQGIKDEVVLAAINTVPRHIFVDEAIASRAYEDSALPIGHGQTISNPYTVARMTELVRAGNSLNRVLEVGAGCGYQLAVLSQIAKEVYAVERIASLVKKARQHLRDIGVKNVRLKHGDGALGFDEGAPFDGIVISAALTHVPETLLSQLREGGKMIFPKGSRDQRLNVITREGEHYREARHEAVKFVPWESGAA